MSKTAVDIFHDGITDLLRNASVNSNTVAKLWIECKAMEREQIMSDYSAGLGYGTAHYIGDATDEEIDPANYYERTYGKEAGNANG